MAHLRIQQQLDDNLRRQTAFANKILQSKHATHELDVEKSTQQDPMWTWSFHGDKIVCKTCNKFVAWIPKAVTETI